MGRCPAGTVARPFHNGLPVRSKFIVLKHRTLHLWLALLLAVIIPISALGNAYTANLLPVAGNTAPDPNQGPTQHEEEETHSQAKIAKEIKRKRGRLLLGRLASALSILRQRPQARTPQTWVPDRSFPAPSTLHLVTSLAHRGPPTA